MNREQIDHFQFEGRKCLSAFSKDAGISEPIGILYHGDPDGVCSAAFFTWYLRRRSINVDFNYWIGTHQLSLDYALKFLSRKNYSTLFIFDINLLSKTENINRIGRLRKSNIFGYDDHIADENIILPDNIYFSNPNIGRKNIVNFPPCLFTYLLNEDENDNISRILISAALMAETILDEFKSELFLNFDANEVFEIVKNISSYYLHSKSKNEYDPVYDKLYSILCENDRNGSNLYDVFHSKILETYKKEIDGALEAETLRICEYANNQKETYDILIADIHSPHRISNIIASQIRNRHLAKVVVTVQERDNFLHAELRRDRRIKKLNLKHILDEIANLCALENYGGHPAAAGASFDLTRKSAFKEVLVGVLGGWFGYDPKVLDYTNRCNES